MNYRILKNNLHRPCPICFNGTGEILHTQKFVIPEGYPLPEIYDVVCCMKCGFVYADTCARQEDYDLYYQNFSKYEDPIISTGSGNVSWDKDRCEGVASEVFRFMPDRNISIIDIGCGNGGILYALKHLGYKNLTALDPSVSCIEYIKQKNNSCRTVVGGLFSQNITDDRTLHRNFDLAILSGVIEHICDVQRAIKNVSNMLKAGGSLYLEVPDASRYANHYVVPYYYFDSEHINHFDMRSLRNLLTMNNFDFIFYKEMETRVSKSNICPAVSVIGKKMSSVTQIRTEPIPDFTVKNSVLKYIEKSKTTECSIRSKLEPFAKTQNTVIVWGAGNFTMRLLTESPLGKCNILALIDNDSKKWGKTIKGVSVYPPDKVKDLKGTLIICAALYSDDILLQIKTMGVENDVIVLK